MAKPYPLQNQFSAGMKRDSPRNRMPPNSAWNIVDCIPDYEAPLRERAGWQHASASVSAVTASASYIRGGIYAVFSPTGGASPKNLCIDEDGILYSFTEAGTLTQIGSSKILAQNPVFHGGTAASAATAVYTGLVIIPDGNGTTVPKKFDGTTLSDLGGAPPKAKFAAVYKDYTVLGHGTVDTTYYPNRIWFSQPGDPDAAVSSVTAWDTTDSWIDFSLPVIGLASTKNALLVFGAGQVSRIRGSTPPPDEDMVVDDPWQKVGLLDPFSITEYQDQVYWCAPEGVFRTDGVTLDDLTLKGGMLKYWLDLATNATTAYTFATGVIRNKLIIAVMNGGTFRDAFMVDLTTYAWVRISNLDAMSFWTGTYGVADETFFGRREQAFVGRVGTMFSTGNSTYKADGDGTAVASTVETPFYELGRPGLKIVKAVHIGFALDDYATDNPSITVSLSSFPEGDKFESIGTLSETPFAPGSFTNVSVYDRQRIQVGGRFYGIALKFVRSGAGDFRGYDLAAEVHHQEESKRR